MPLRLSKNRVLLDGIPLNESKASNLASAATIDIWSVTGNVVPITGTATISAFSTAPQAGTKRTLLCISTPTFTHGANFLLPGSADYTATAGDRIEVLAITTTQFRLSIIKSSVLPDVQFATDGSGNVTGIKSPGGGIYATFGSSIITIGADGRFSNLADAIAARNAISHTFLTSFTGSLLSSTSGGTVQVTDLVANSGTPLASYIGMSVGFKVNDPANVGDGSVVTTNLNGNAIVRGIVISNNTIRAHYPFPADVTALVVDVYYIKPVVMHFLPGARILISGHQVIPAFTTLYAAPHTASLQLADITSALWDDSTQNEIFIDGVDMLANTIETPFTNYSLFWSLPCDGNQAMCDFGIKNSYADFGHVDGIYYNNTQGISGAGTPFSPGLGGTSGVQGGGLIVQDCNMRGYFDLIKISQMRKFIVRGNELNSRATKYAVQGDTFGSCIGFGKSTFGYTPTAYPQQNYLIENNFIRQNSEDLYATGTVPPSRPIDIRGKMPSISRVRIRGNHIQSKCLGGTNPAYGVNVGSTSTTESPYIEVTGNLFDVTNTGSGAANIMNSASATYIINRANNTVAPGSSSILGTNTAALTLQ